MEAFKAVTLNVLNFGLRIGAEIIIFIMMMMMLQSSLSLEGT